MDKESLHTVSERNLLAQERRNSTLNLKVKGLFYFTNQRLLELAKAGFFGAGLLVVFFLLPEEKFFANQSEMSGKSLDWLNMFIDDCISYEKKDYKKICKRL